MKEFSDDHQEKTDDAWKLREYRGGWHGSHFQTGVALRRTLASASLQPTQRGAEARVQEDKDGRQQVGKEKQRKCKACTARRRKRLQRQQAVQSEESLAVQGGVRTVLLLLFLRIRGELERGRRDSWRT